MIFLDANVISETLKKSPDPAVIAWLIRHDAELARPTVTIAEIAFGIQKVRPGQRAERLEQGLSDWRRRFADRIFGLTEEAAMVYGNHGYCRAAGPGDVGARWHDCCNLKGEWRPLGDAEFG